MSLRYQAPVGPEAEFQPGSHRRVLRNLRGITRKGEMDRAEYEAFLRAQEASYQRFSADTRFTAAALCEMHRDWLGGIYPWAGRYRTLDLSKAGFTWPPAHRVAENMAAFEAGLLARHTPCRPAPLPEVARRLAEVHAELLLIHPFRDGNGRLARWLAGLMAAQAGLLPPEFALVGPGSRSRRAEYLAAVAQGYVCDYEALTRFFGDALERRLGAG